MKLALGTAQFGLAYGIANNDGKVGQSEVAKILARARESSIDTLDTAIAYGDSEARLGGVGVNGFKIVTKLPPDVNADIEVWVHQNLRASMRRLGIDAVYGLLVHRPKQLLGPDGPALANALKNLKNQGLVKKIGASIYDTEELDALTRVCKFDLIQAPFNVFDQRLMTSGWLARLHALGVEVHIRSAFLQGLLLMPLDRIPVKFRPWSELFDRWHLWLNDHESTALQACLAFVNHPMIDRVVVGVDSVIQLNEILQSAINLPLGGLTDLACDNKNIINPSNWNYL
jgi:aryl-alcohol dehydrogenase-like predicted oxidoreductase